MIFDPLAPIQSMDTKRDRVERLLVSFDGFIKNQAEGMIRTMLSELDTWIEIYPILSMYDEMTMDEIYDAVSLYQPYDLLYEMSGKERSHEDILNDLDQIIPNIFLENSKITQFEYTLYRLLLEDKVEYCCIYKESAFYENELAYIRHQYKNVIDKIELVDKTPLPVIFADIKPTTAFITDPAFVFGFIEEAYSGENEKEIDKTMFIVLNNTDLIEIEDNVFVYTEHYKESMEELNSTKNYGVASMFNFALQETPNEMNVGSDEDEDDDDEEEEDYDDFEEEMLDMEDEME